jgi:hypothetical protein
MKSALLAISAVANLALVLWAVQLHGQLLEARASQQASAADAEQAWGEAKDARKDARHLQARVDETTKEHKVLTDELVDLRERVKHPPVAAPPAREAEVKPVDQSAKEGNGLIEGLGKMMEDPKMQDAMRAQQKVVLNMIYGSLFEQLNLPEPDATRLRELLVDRQMLGIRFMAEARTNPKDAAALMKQAREDSNAALNELLGDDAYKTYKEYESTLAERALVGQFRQSLGNSLENRLTVEQEESLVALMATKREELGLPNQQEREEAFFAGGGADAAAVMERYLENQGKVNAAVAAEAGDILTETQLKQFTEFQNGQLEMQKLGIQMMKNMGKAKANK